MFPNYPKGGFTLGISRQLYTWIIAVYVTVGVKLASELLCKGRLALDVLWSVKSNDVQREED